MSNVTVYDEEYVCEDKPIISQTDLQGNFTHVNRMFCETSGYTVNELIGNSYSIIRHPDMPKATFEKMWDAIAAGHTWNGIIKNLRKDGTYFWVNTEILPIEDEEQNLIGFISSSKPASEKSIEEAAELYKKMIEDEH